jgi:hypothetical protein
VPGRREKDVVRRYYWRHGWRKSSNFWLLKVSCTGRSAGGPGRNSGTCKNNWHQVRDCRQAGMASICAVINNTTCQRPGLETAEFLDGLFLRRDWRSPDCVLGQQLTILECQMADKSSSWRRTGGDLDGSTSTYVTGLCGDLHVRQPRLYYISSDRNWLSMQQLASSLKDFATAADNGSNATVEYYGGLLYNTALCRPTAPWRTTCWIFILIRVCYSDCAGCLEFN